MNKQIEALKPKLEAAQQKLKDLKAASGPAWDKLKEGFEKAMADLKKGWESVQVKISIDPDMLSSGSATGKGLGGAA